MKVDLRKWKEKNGCLNSTKRTPATIIFNPPSKTMEGSKNDIFLQLEGITGGMSGYTTIQFCRICKNDTACTLVREVDSAGRLVDVYYKCSVCGFPMPTPPEALC